MHPLRLRLISDKNWEERPSTLKFLRFHLLRGYSCITFLCCHLLRGNPRISSNSSFAWNYSRFLLIPGKPRISCFSSFARNYRTFVAFLRLPGIPPLLGPPPSTSGPFGQVGNIRLKMEEFAAQVEGGGYI